MTVSSPVVDHAQSSIPVPSADFTDILYGPSRPDLLRNETLADLLEASSTRTPEHIALIFGEQQLSYGALNARADRLASRLITAGVRPGQIVGLWLPRGLDLLVMQAAIAKTGAAWMPFDADTPIERIAVCIEDAGAVGILSCHLFESQLQQHLPAAAPNAPRIWTAEALQAAADDAADEPLLVRQNAQPSDPAYVIYTSGSTGKPKGIVVDQGAICHFLRSENSRLGIHAGDRVYQGFSVAFDMSFEEIWISYLVGASLWIAPKILSADPEQLPLALAANAITVLHAVPTLLALFAQDVPSLRLINLGGEMCPDALVARWAQGGRQLFNTYGPTEATVSASLAQLHAGEAVTIGQPLPNYGMLVIDADNALDDGPGAAAGEQAPLRLLPRGAIGELCIIGPGVATGYLRRPELSAEKFIANPWAGAPLFARLYRTGDLARIDEHGQVQCLGRTDDQVKIRGFRVELGEIEAVLSRQPGVGTAAVILRRDDGIDQLIAFVVADSSAGTAATAVRAATLRRELALALPPYMVPGIFEILPAMPRLQSGKIDRKTLKALPLALTAGGADDSDLPTSPAEVVLFAALKKLFPGQPIMAHADFFSDLGGHSLLAARLASSLRTDALYAHVTVGDIYRHRTVELIAKAIGEPVMAGEADAPQWTPPPAWRRWACGIAQAAAIPVLVSLRMVQWMAPFFTYHFFTGDIDDSIARAIAMSVGGFLLATLLEFALAVGAKRLIAGGIKPGRYPLWGLTYYRWWLADRLVESAPAYMLAGSSLYPWWLRALGAKIGRDVMIGSITLRAADMLEIGDGASIGNAVNLENARVEHGELRLGTIHIGEHACIGSYAVLEGDVRIESYGHLEGQSALADGTTLPAGRLWTGSPARDIGAFDRNAQPPRPPISQLRRIGEASFFVFGALLITTLFFLPVFPSFVMIDFLDDADRFPWVQGNAIWFQLVKYFALAFPATGILVILTALLAAGIRWTFLPRLSAGSWPTSSNIYCCKWLVNQIQEASLNVLHGLYATVYAPLWYRLLGAKVGRDAEISTALGVVPDMLTLGDETFIADAVLLGDEQIDGGWITMQPTVISRRSFVGNGSYVPDGTTLPENVLIGVHSKTPNNEQMVNGDTWLGSPPINLPARETTSGFPENLTFKPSPLRRLGRGLVEAFRIVAPHAIVTAFGYTLVFDVMPIAGAGRWSEVLQVLTVAGLLYGLGTYIFILVLKWGLLVRYKKCSVPMWTPFVWLSEGVTNLYEGIAVPNFMRYLRGTPWLPLALNLLGTHIGRGVYLDTTDITEFDCVTIGDYSELNALSCPQTHLFEDRVMKIDQVMIGSKVYMGPRSSVLYSAVVGDNAKLGALTLVMKGEFIPGASSWRGCPAAPARAA